MFVASPHCNAVEVSLWTLTELFWNCLANVFSLIIAQELVGLQWCLNSPELNTSKLASSSFEETLRRVFTILQNREQNAFGGHNNIIYQVQQNRDAAPRTRSVWPGLNTGILCKRRMQAPSVVVTATNCNPLLLFFLKPFTHEKDWTTFRTRSHKCTKSGGGDRNHINHWNSDHTHVSQQSCVLWQKCFVVFSDKWLLLVMLLRFTKRMELKNASPLYRATLKENNPMHLRANQSQEPSPKLKIWQNTNQMHPLSKSCDVFCRAASTFAQRTSESIFIQVRKQKPVTLVVQCFYQMLGEEHHGNINKIKKMLDPIAKTSSKALDDFCQPRHVSAELVYHVLNGLHFQFPNRQFFFSRRGGRYACEANWTHGIGISLQEWNAATVWDL